MARSDPRPNYVRRIKTDKLVGTSARRANATTAQVPNRSGKAGPNHGPPNQYAHIPGYNTRCRCDGQLLLRDLDNNLTCSKCGKPK